jgi:hypothetical protein
MSLCALNALSTAGEGDVVTEEEGGVRGGLEANYAARGKLAAVNVYNYARGWPLFS